MQMQEIRIIAKTLNIKTGKLSKADLIKSIQREEGNFDCFGSVLNGYCDQGNCLWRSDCFAGASSKS